MQITTQDIGAFFRALGEQMIEEDGVSVGAVLGTAESRKAMPKRMTERKGHHQFKVEPDVAGPVIEAFASDPGECFREWLYAFGDITIPAQLPDAP